jgi:hypothetical protein
VACERKTGHAYSIRSEGSRFAIRKSISRWSTSFFLRERSVLSAGLTENTLLLALSNLAKEYSHRQECTRLIPSTDCSCAILSSRTLACRDAKCGARSHTAVSRNENAPRAQTQTPVFGQNGTPTSRGVEFWHTILTSFRFRHTASQNAAFRLPWDDRSRGDPAWMTN